MWYLKEAIKGFPKLQFKIQQNELQARIMSYRGQYSFDYAPNYQYYSTAVGVDEAASAVGLPGGGVDGLTDGATTAPSGPPVGY